MKFYNRKKELETLVHIEKMANSHAQMTVIVGRRRVGKTELIRHFLEGGKNCFYFFVERKRSQPLLEEFTNILNQKYSLLVNPFLKWDNFFQFIFEISKKEPIIVVLDEFQNFKFVDVSVFSTLQKYWDMNSKQSKINLILVGSVTTLMEKIFRDNKEPLFGRVNHKIYIEPFNSTVVRDILADYNKDKFKDLLDFYTVFGGVPKYYVELENLGLFKEKDFFKIISKVFLEETAPFKEEGYDLLSQEFGKNYQTYFSILQVIASGSTKPSEIADKIGIPITAIPRYIDTLSTRYNFIKKKTPLFSPYSKNNRYYLNDRFLIFWFRYIFRFKSLIEIKKNQDLLEFIRKDIVNLQGFVFEGLVYDFILNEDRAGKFVFPIEGLGNFWDKRGNEIDIVVFNEKSKEIIFLECKLSPKQINQDVIDNLKRKAQFVKWFNSSRKEYYGVCTAGVIDYRTKNKLLAQDIKIYEF